MPEPGAIDIREYELPEPEPGAALLRTAVAGICGSELHMFHGRHAVLKSVVLGHEIVGEVVSLGADLEADRAGAPLAVGDLVTATYFQACMGCRACELGEPRLCERGYEHWLRSPDEPPHFIGTLATHYYVGPHQWIYKLPANVPPIAAASANCALAQMVAAIDRSGVGAGESIVIQGLGGLGLYGTALAHERGAHVIGVDSVPGRLARAADFGAAAVVDLHEHPTPQARAERIRELLGGEAPDVVMGVAGVPDTFLEGTALVRPGGRYVEVGNVLPGSEISFDLGALVRRAVSVLPVIRYEPAQLGEALAFLSRNLDRYPLASMLDRTYPLDEVQTALDDASAHRVTRAAIVPT
jgi:D-arabinose 1-dehydrogenase-like Zn-dependent alcohol dehydrogenase